jgi:prepilin-type N-terminal cleavage/methylation domain-containing protein
VVIFLFTINAMNKNQYGFSVVELLVVAAVLGVLGLVGWNVLSRNNSKNSGSSSTSQSQDPKSGSGEESQGLIWQQTADGWQAQQKAPECPAQPMFKAPADVSKVTAVLYPGQTRGGNYKPHGGFRFDTTSDNKVTVTAPLEGYIVKGTRYIADGENEIQYGFDIMNNCGIMYRVGHLRELPDNLQKIAETFPEAGPSSMNTNVNPAVFVKQGEVLATKVGITSANNTFFDWGVYDYRQGNEASKSAAYQSAHSEDKELAWHAVCWLQDGWLPNKDQDALAGLPAGDPASGKNSDYCIR